MSTLIGPLLVLAFTLSQSLRDVYFGVVFQGVDFFAILLLAFGALDDHFRRRGVAARAAGLCEAARPRPRRSLLANLTTALAWSCYFFALTHVDPSVVNTIHSAMGPLDGRRARLVRHPAGADAESLGWIENLELRRHRRVDRRAVVGGAVGPIRAWRSAVSRDTVLGLALLIVSGVSITVSLLYCKRLQDAGIGADTVTAVRYIAIIALAGGVAFWNGGLGGIDTIGQGVTALRGFDPADRIAALCASRSASAASPRFSAQIIRALGPIFVFAIAQFDGRMHYSMPVLICIVIYSVSVLVSNLARGWRDEQATLPTAPVPQARG